jgi:BOP1NT (NUC169) domain
MVCGPYPSTAFETSSFVRNTAFDKTAQMDRPLSNEELDIIRRLYANEVPDANYDPYEPMTEWFTGKGKEEIMPLSSAPEPKRRWIPSKWEKQKVCHLSYPSDLFRPIHVPRS